VLPGSFQQQQSYGQIANPLLVNDFNFGIQGTQETFNTG
jgi:hypothetical protein